MSLKYCSASFILANLFLFSLQADEQSKPNFLFILTDDQASESLSCYGNKVCKTPNIDEIAKQGMVIRDAHHMGSWSGAVCTPSRTMIMTGRHVWNIPGAKGPGLDFPESFRAEVADQSLPAIFNRAGYDTFRTCKKGNSFKQANELFQILHEATRRQATQEEGSCWHGDRVIEFLDERQKGADSDPFFIFMGLSHPHDPRNAPPEFLKNYGASNQGPSDKPNPAAPPLPINYLPVHPFPHGHPGLRDENNVQGVKDKRDEATIRNELGREYACIENIDQQIGRVLTKLGETGQLSNTYIIFTSDHGIAVGRHGLVGKQNLYEHTWRVPLIVMGPGIETGSTASGFVYLMDILPTLCDLADIEIPEGVAGQSFKSVLKGEQSRIRDVLYGVYCGGTKPGMRSVKTSDGWKLVEYNVLGKEVRETQMFDLNVNPHEFLAEHHAEDIKTLLAIDPSPEQTNLANKPEFAVKRKELETLLAAEMKKFGDPYDLEKAYEKPSQKNKLPQ